MLFVYQSTNPCNCSSSSVISDPGCEDACTCLQLCIPPIPSNSEDAVDPCGGELILDLASAEYEHDTCACGESDQKWYLAYYDTEVFETVTVSESGDLNATTVSTSVDVLHSNIIVKFVCGNLSAYVTIVVGIRNMCVNSCVEGEECNPCTGICQPITNIGVS